MVQQCQQKYDKKYEVIRLVVTRASVAPQVLGSTHCGANFLEKTHITPSTMKGGIFHPLNYKTSYSTPQLAKTGQITPQAVLTNVDNDVAVTVRVLVMLDIYFVSVKYVFVSIKLVRICVKLLKI
jgi:hypothetical protein